MNVKSHHSSVIAALGQPMRVGRKIQSRLSVYSRENTVWIQEMEPSGHRLPHFDLETPQHGLTGDFRLPIFGPTTTQLYITFQDEVRTDGMTVRYYSKHSGSSHQKADSCEIVAPQ